MNGIVDQDSLERAVVSPEPKRSNARVGVLAGLLAAIHRKVEVAFGGYDFALFCLTQRGFGSLAQASLEQHHVGWIIAAALVEMNRAGA